MAPEDVASPPDEPVDRRLRPAQDWRPFLRALAEEIDAVAGAAGRDALLHGVGLQLARMYPLPARDSTDALAMEMTETLEGFGWGRVLISFSERERCLYLTHTGLPRVGGGGDPPGAWLAGVLEGLYEGWMGQQAGADATLVARRVPSATPEADGPWSGRDFTGCIAERTFCVAFPVRERGMFRFIGVIPEALRSRDNLSFDDLRDEVEPVTGTRVTKVNWFSTYRVHHRVADHFREGRVFLSGDAGHVHSPAGGQGMNTGIGDAVNLAWKLAAVLGGRANSALLDSYEAERIPFARTLVRTTDRIFETAVGRGLFSRVVRSALVPFLMPIALRFAAVRRAQFRLVSQTRIAYREGPLGDGSAGAVHAGDRLPWVEGTDNFAPLASLAWQVHIYGTAPAALREFATGVNLPLHQWPWTPAARRAGLERDALYLVRPDGHVGFARRGPDVEGLRAYLGRLGVVGLPG